jgi:hypothetical protein
MKLYFRQSFFINSLNLLHLPFVSAMHVVMQVKGVDFLLRILTEPVQKVIMDSYLPHASLKPNVGMLEILVEAFEALSFIT